jgi:hypothetical protein
LGAGGVEGVGHAVVLAGLPDDRVPVVLAAVVAALVGRHPIVGIQLVEGPFALADRIPGELGVGVRELGRQAGVVVAVAGVQVAAEAAGDLVDRPVAELVAADGGRGLQVLQQLPVTGDSPVVRVWWAGWARV